MLYRIGPAILLVAFFIGGCGGPSEYRYNDSMKTYVASDHSAGTNTSEPAKTTYSSAGQQERTTAYYVYRPGDRPDFQPKVRQVQAIQAPAPDQPGTPEPESVELKDLQMVLEVSDILFQFDKWVINQSDVPELNRWVDYFQSHPQVKAEIYGHADSIGPSAYNQNLSQKRAQAVVNYLVSKGVDSKRLTAKGFGESQPVAPNTNPEGRQKNRRVELKI